MFRVIFVSLLVSFVGVPSFASTCEVTRIPPNGKPVPVELKHNEIFEKNNPGKTQLMEADEAFPYGLIIATDKSNDDVTIIITFKLHNYSQAGASGAFDSEGKFETGITLNTGSTQDLVQVDCKK